MGTENLTSTEGRVAIIMAGGLGSRLGALAEDVPKPMLKIGGKPILAHSILHLKKYGFTSFIISIKYKAALVKSFFGSGEKWGIDISYVEEPDDFLGTAGPLALLEEVPKHPFLLINGDILTTLNVDSLWQHHHEQKTQATICVREHHTQYPYGIVKSEQGKLTSLTEKPSFTHLINAGIYVLTPSILEYVPSYQYLDMTDLFQIMLADGMQPSIYIINEKWIDIGTPEDFLKAKTLFLPSMSTHAN
ncbi:MAG: sugar phosphate nucleotidyltransferase [Bacteroidota bacterium]